MGVLCGSKPANLANTPMTPTEEVVFESAGTQPTWKRALPYLGPVVGLIGISLALYFHAQSTQERIPTYYISPQRSVIVDGSSGIPSDLQVLYRGQAVPARTIVVMSVYVWNAGKLPIRTSDILEPVQLEVSDSSEILEATVVRVSRAVTRFRLDPVSATQKNVVGLKFDILEQDDGAAIQLIYAGSPTASVALRGTIVGVATPRFISAISAERYLKKRRSIDNRLSLKLLPVASGLIMLSAFGLAIYHALKRRRQGKRSSLVYLALALTSAVLYGYLGYDSYRVARDLAPDVPRSIWTSEHN